METKDYSLLRPFDLEAAKRGEAICWFNYGNDDAIGKKLRLVGPSTSTRAGCFEWLEGEYAGTFETYSADNIRMSPLCWVEGRPVYRGDVLYGIERCSDLTYIADKVNADGLLISQDGTSGRCEQPNRLTWTPPAWLIADSPQPMRTVKLLAYLDKYSLTWWREDSDAQPSGTRVPSEDKVIEIEEPAEVAK